MKQNQYPKLCYCWLFTTLCFVQPAPAFAENLGVESQQAKQKSPWSGNLSAYLWTAGVKGDFTSGKRSGTVDASFIDVWGKSKRPPLGFMGRLEVHYERLGFFIDGNYMDIQLKPRFGAVSEGIHSQMGLMDYGFGYRVFGARPEDLDEYQDKKRPNVLDVYVGARTLWLGNSINFSGPLGLLERTPQTGRSFTAPLLGGRFMVDFSPHWFVLGDANFGGFGADKVSFTGSLMGMVGYRTTMFGVPASVEAGYRAVRYNVDGKGSAATNATLNGPFLGLTGYW